MLPASWADDIRMKNRPENRPLWHYVNFPFKPDGEPDSVQTKPPAPVNIITALSENERIARSVSDPQKRAISLTWLFHLIGDVHQPLHTVSLFTREYPRGDRGGNEICVRVTADRAPLDLHALWDRLLTSTNNVRTLRNLAIELRSRFPKGGLTELVSVEPEAWAKESFEIATKIAYQNGALRGTPKGSRKECRELNDAAVLPRGYASTARHVADRRIILAGYRLADVVKQVTRPQ